MSGFGTPAEPDNRVPALASGLERVTRRVSAIEDGMGELAEAMAELTAGGESKVLVSSLDDPEQIDVDDLLGWLDRVYLAYDDARLAPCVWWHFAVLEELRVLRLAHQAVYASGSALKVSDWHDRHRPGVVRRIHQALSGCDIDNHRPVPPTPTVPLHEALTAIATARNSNSPVPAPTDTQAAQARNLTTRSKATT